MWLLFLGYEMYNKPQQRSEMTTFMQTYIISKYLAVCVEYYNIDQKAHFFPICVHVISYPTISEFNLLLFYQAYLFLYIHNTIVMHAWKIYLPAFSGFVKDDGKIVLTCAVNNVGAMQVSWIYRLDKKLTVCSGCFIFWYGVDNRLNHGIYKHRLTGLC